jgi:hypothetical protein
VRTKAMHGYLPGYTLDLTTWVYLSSFLTIGVFFKFNRFWCVRNLDLIALIGLAPGLLWVQEPVGPGGYIWLFTLASFFLVRLLLDPLMVRRPLLEPNLNASGLAFTGIALLAFLMTNVVTGNMFPIAKRPISSYPGVQRSGYPLLYEIADLSQGARQEQAAPEEATGPEPAPQETASLEGASRETTPRQTARVVAVRAMAVLALLALVIGIALIGYGHFGNVHTGVAMASLYLLLPYTAQMTPRVDHVVPAALLVGAVGLYRRPALAGIMIGLAAGLIGYPLFLLPLWCGFYWRRGLVRFAVGVVSGWVLLVVFVLVVLVVLSLMGVSGVGTFGGRLVDLFGWARLPLVEADGFWENHVQAFRIPVVAGFCVLCGSMALWPAQKNLGTLLSCSAAVMLGVQFWHPYQGGLYMAWYLPLLVLTIFRPNLEDRLAVAAVTEARAPWQTAGWIPWRMEDWLPWRREARGEGRKKAWLPWRKPAHPRA